MDGFVLMMNSLQRINKLISQYSGNAARYTFADVIGESEACRHMVETCKAAAATGSSILLLGESGVGKDVLAQAIHAASDRAEHPFVAVNCAAFSRELISSELFGYEPGAFTGANKEGSIGKFTLADNGTLFLDEIGDMPLDVQAVLLRVLEQGCFTKVGGTEVHAVNVRIIAATNRHLPEKISQGLFREDLFYRLGVVRIHVPPLRDRHNDVFLLAEHCLRQMEERLNKPPILLTEDARIFLKNYHWPGNIRELFNLLEGILSIHGDRPLNARLIHQYLGDTKGLPGEGPRLASEEVPESFSPASERREVQQALALCRNNRTKAAATLGMSRRTFYRRLAEYGLL